LIVIQSAKGKTFVYLFDGEHLEQCDVCDMVVASQYVPITCCPSKEIPNFNEERLVLKAKPEVNYAVPIKRVAVNLLFSRLPPFYSKQRNRLTFTIEL